MSETQTHSTRVGLIRRLMTIVYDSFLIFACCLLTGGIVVAIKVSMTAPEQLEAMRANGERVISGPTESLILFAVCLITVFAFYTYFWRKTGQTLAMQAWRSKIIDSRTGDKPTFKQCIIRFVVGFVSFAAGGLGFLWMLVDADKKTWQDKASGTELQLQPKRKK